MALEIRHLRYFVAVAEERHITRAAERLGIQQPPLSQQIKVIERDLDVQLFRRKARGVELTEAGHAFFADARAILAQLDRAREATKRAARGEQGRICIGVTSTAPFHPLVSRSIRAFREAYPKVSVTLEECLSNELIERLQTERTDVAFVRTSQPGAGALTLHPLVEEPMVAALPSHHPLATGTSKPVTLKQLSAETFILYGPPGTGMYDAIIAACQKAGFNPRVGNLGASTQQAPRITSTLSLVAAGLGVTCVPASLQRMNLDGVVYRVIRGSAQPKVKLNLALRRGDTAGVVQTFASVVRQVARDLQRP